MKRLLPIAVCLVLGACDYAPAEKVRQLSREVDHVKTEQRFIRSELDTAVDSQKLIQTSVNAMGAGFNVLTESVTEQDARVERLETSTARIKEDLVRGRGASASRSRNSPQPSTIGQYIGVRIDTRTLDEKITRLQWCEAAEGYNGYIAVGGQDPDFNNTRCWRYGTVALFRSETQKGPRVVCLNDIELDEEGNLQALDCEDPAVLYRLRMR